MSKQAYLWYNSGLYSIMSWPEQDKICSSMNRNRSIRKARKLGWSVKIFKSVYEEAPKGAESVSLLSYILLPL